MEEGKKDIKTNNGNEKNHNEKNNKDNGKNNVSVKNDELIELPQWSLEPPINENDVNNGGSL